MSRRNLLTLDGMKKFETRQTSASLFRGLSGLCFLPWRPAKGSLRKFPAVVAAVSPGRVATLVVGRVRTARPPWPPMEPAILRGMSRGWPRDPVWANIPVIRVAKLSWDST